MPLAYSQIEGGSNKSAPQAMVKLIRDNWCVTGRRSISAEYKPNATSAELAFEQLVLLVKQNAGGRELARSDIKSLLYLLIDVVIQFGVEKHQRFIKEIWFDPERKHRCWESECTVNE